MTLSQWVTQRFHSHYGKHHLPPCHKMNVLLDIAEGYAQYKTTHQRNIIHDQSKKIKELEDKIKGMEDFNAAIVDGWEGFDI